MSCKRRHSFETETEAEKFLRFGAYSNRATGQRPIRWYRCTKCHKYHVTSKPKVSKYNG